MKVSHCGPKADLNITQFLPCGKIFREINFQFGYWQISRRKGDGCKIDLAESNFIQISTDIQIPISLK